MSESLTHCGLAQEAEALPLHDWLAQWELSWKLEEDLASGGVGLVGQLAAARQLAARFHQTQRVDFVPIYAETHVTIRDEDPKSKSYLIERLYNLILWEHKKIWLLEIYRIDIFRFSFLLCRRDISCTMSMWVAAS